MNDTEEKLHALRSEYQRKIIRGIRIENIVYVPGMEDALSKVLSQSEITRLCSKSYLVWPGAASSKCEACGGDGLIEIGAYRGDPDSETRRCSLCGAKT